MVPEVKNIYLENIHDEDGGEYGIFKGYAELPISHITLTDVVIKKVDTVYALENVKFLNFINTRINGKLMESINLTE